MLASKKLYLILVGLSAVIVIGVLLILGLTSHSGDPQEETPAARSLRVYNEVAAAYWANLTASDPLTATYVGEQGAINSQLGNLSWAAIEQQVAQRAQLYEQAQQIDPSLLVGQDAQINARLLLTLLEYQHQRDRFVELDSLMPISTMDGPQIELPAIVGVTPFATTDDYQYFLRRLAAIPTYIDQTIDLMKKGVDMGITQACDFIQQVPDQIQSQLVTDPTDSDFYQPFLAPEAATLTTAAMRNEAATAIQNGIVPAFQRLYDYFTEHYLHQCHRTTAAGQTVGLGALPNGLEYYQALVIESTTDPSQTPAAIYALGLQQIALVQGQMQQALSRSNFSGTLQEYFDYLRDAPQYKLSPAELLLHARDFGKQVDAMLPSYFAVLPRCPYAIIPVPEGIAESSPAGYYDGPDPECTRPGYFHLNTGGKVPTYLLPSLFLHEAVPGHHLQIALANELQSLPPFRIYSDWTAYVEGWAHFAEYFGEAMGFYQDPAVDIGRLSDAMLRACRLAIDSGIHAGNMTRDEAIQLLASNSAISLDDIIAEVDRYGSWPAQATAYRTGALKFFQLRTHAQSQLGSRYDQRHFYSTLLSHGPLPMNIVAEIVDAYIQSVLQQNS